MRNEKIFDGKFELFSNEQLGGIRATVIDGEPWFVGGDVCKILDIVNQRNAYARLKESQKYRLPLNVHTVDVQTRAQNTTSGRGGARFMMLMSESGMYRIIMTSKKKEAMIFMDWITDEVLPSIRKNGGYILGQEDLPAADQAALSAEVARLHEQVAKKKARIHELTVKNANLRAAKAKAKAEAKAQAEYADIVEGIADGYYSEMMRFRSELKKLTDAGSDTGAGSTGSGSGREVWTDAYGYVYSSREEYLAAVAGRRS